MRRMLTRFNLVHLSGPLPRRATCCLQSRFDAREVWFVVYLWREASKNGKSCCPRTTEQWRNCRKIAISNNVGTVKHFPSTPLHALGEERHFALVDGLRVPTWARSVSLGSGTQSDPAISSIPTAIMITASNSPVKGSGIPNHYVGELLVTMAISGLSRVSVGACGPPKLMKISSRKNLHSGRGGSFFLTSLF